MADGGERSLALRDDRLDVRRGRTGGEPLVDLDFDPERLRDRRCRLARTYEWARQDGRRARLDCRKSVTEGLGLVEPLRGQLAELVRLSGSRFGVSAEVDEHRTTIVSPLEPARAEPIPAPLLRLQPELAHVGCNGSTEARYKSRMPTLRYVLCDVFTDTPLAGNQLAVFTDGREASEEQMQQLAREICFSEIVFVLPAEGEGDARIRIFNPLYEMDFAGHPTLGAAFVLGAPLQLGVITLETGAGPVPVVLERDESGRIVFGRMQQPLPQVTPFPEAAAAIAAVGATGSTLPVELYDNGARHLILTFASVSELAALRPDTDAIANLGLTGISCIAPDGDRVRSRMFWQSGEDPATGSAAGPIACHLCRHGLLEWGAELVIDQGVEMGRPSVLHARVEGGDGRIDAVEVGGSAVTVARGEFKL